MKLKIDNETLVEEFFECTRLLGIVAPVKDYQFSWHINQAMGFNFRLNNNLEIELKKKGRNYYFPIFEYAVDGCCMVHYLYNNHNDGEGEEMENDELSALQQSLKLLPGVQLVNEMTHEKIKNKQHLIL